MFRLRAPSTLSPIGIDLAADGVKMVQLRTSRDAVEVVAAIRLAADPNDRVLAAAIRAAVASEGFRGDRCVLALARGDAIEGSVRIPAGSPSGVQCTARNHAARWLNADPETIEVRVTPSGAALHSAAEETEILLTAVSRDIVRGRMQTLASAGLRPVAVETASTALARCDSGPSPLRIVLDVGATGSTLIIARAADVLRVRLIATGVVEIDRAVRRRLHGYAGARSGLMSLRRAGVDDHPAVADAIDPHVRLIVGELRLALRSYGCAFRGAGPDRVIVTGGGSRVPGLTARIKLACDLPVVVDDRLEFAVADAAPIWTVAAGLARHTAGPGHRISERTAA